MPVSDELTSGSRKFMPSSTEHWTKSYRIAALECRIAQPIDR
jgi:hypothetical protein